MMKEKLQYYSIYIRYWLLTWMKIAPLILRHGPLQSLRELKRYPWLLTLLKVNNLLGRFGHGRSANYQKATSILVSGVVSGVVKIVGDIFFRPDKIIIHEDMVPPEIFRAMGLCPYMAELNSFLLPAIEPHSLEKYIDASENEGIPPDICSLPKGTMGLFLREEAPPGIAIVSSNMPCDAGMASYAIIEKKTGLPTFRLDIPYNFSDPEARSYFVGELKRMIKWLEEHTPGKMDWDRLREICEERNRMVEHELELWDLFRIRPSPIAGETVWLTHLWYFNLFPGTKQSTKAVEKILSLGKKNLTEGISAIENEKFRTLLWNPPLLHFIDLFNWAEKAYGVSLVMDSLSFNRLPFIDTSTHETLLEGLGYNIMNGPMARHTRGPASNYLNDIFYIHKHFDIDMIWVAGHIGCKNTMALNGMLREKCREVGLPLLIINYDLTDPRTVSRDGIIGQINHFMENTMKAKRLDV